MQGLPQSPAAVRLVGQEPPEKVLWEQPGADLHGRPAGPVGVHRPGVLRVQPLVELAQNRPVPGEEQQAVHTLPLGVLPDKPAITQGKEAAVHKAVLIRPGKFPPAVVELPVYQGPVHAAHQGGEILGPKGPSGSVDVLVGERDKSLLLGPGPIGQGVVPHMGKSGAGRVRLPQAAEQPARSF